MKLVLCCVSHSHEGVAMRRLSVVARDIRSTCALWVKAAVWTADDTALAMPGEHEADAESPVNHGAMTHEMGATGAAQMDQSAHGAHGMHDMSDPAMAKAMEADMRRRFFIAL